MGIEAKAREDEVGVELFGGSEGFLGDEGLEEGGEMVVMGMGVVRWRER